MPFICLPPHHAGHTIELNLLVNPAEAQPPFVFQGTDRLSARHSNPSGDLDFSDFNEPVAVIVHLYDGTGKYLLFPKDRDDVMEFAKDYGYRKLHVRPGHYQIWDVNVPARTTLTFCYRNTQHDDEDRSAPPHTRSAYGIFMIDQSGRIRPIDPGIHNGGNQ